MEKSELISVIVPVYNKESVIQRCIESIARQSYQMIQIIIINDGSTDGSLAKCREYASKDDRILIIDQKNGGAGSARNAGLDAAKGEYICFVDSDDHIKEKYIELLYETLKDNKSDIACCNHEVEKDGRQHHLIEKPELLSPDEAIRSMWHDGKIKIAPWGKLYKTSLWSDIRFKEVYAGEDYATTYKVFLRATLVAYTEIPLYIYCFEKGSQTNSFFEKKREFLDVAEEVIADCDDNYQELSIYARTKGFDMACQYYCQVDDCSQDKYDGYNKKALDMICEYRKDVFKDEYARRKSVVAALLSGINPILVRKLYRLWWK